MIGAARALRPDAIIGKASEIESPFHEGERRIQSLLGVREELERRGRKIVRPYMLQQHRDFHSALPFFVVGARDGDGRPWATVLEGAPGFIRSPDARTLVIDALPAGGDPLEQAFIEGADVGGLGIDFATRRRNRVNGRVAGDGVVRAAGDGVVAGRGRSARSRGSARSGRGTGFVLAVDQAFGNCRRFIRRRQWRRVIGEASAPAATLAPTPTPGPTPAPAFGPTPEPAPAPERAIERGPRLTPSARAVIEQADTFFIASGHRARGERAAFGMDVSHRGGEPGSVRVLRGDTVVFPDYAGNDHFNTFGNLAMDPRAGLLFMDFAAGTLVQLTGRAMVDWLSADIASYPGAQRLVRFEIEEVVERRGALATRWEQLEP